MKTDRPKSQRTLANERSKARKIITLMLWDNLTALHKAGIADQKLKDIAKRIIT